MDRLVRAGVLSHGTIGGNTRLSVAAMLERELGIHQLTLYGLASAPDRATLQVRDGNGEVRAFVKVAASRSAHLEREATALDRLIASDLKVLLVPRILARTTWNGLDMLVLEPIPSAGRADRPIRDIELRAVLEIHRALSTTGVRDEAGRSTIHGDFTAWNSAPVGDGRLAVWDWESCRRGSPVEDYLHWRVMQAALLGVGTPAVIASDLREPSVTMQWFFSQAGVSTDDAIAAAVRYCGIATGPQGEQIAGRIGDVLVELSRELSR